MTPILLLRKLGATLISIGFLYSGILLIYRGQLKPSQLKSVRSKIQNVNIDKVSTSNGISFAIAFDINAWGSRHGIYLGSRVSSKEEKIYESLDSNTIYTIAIDPTVTTANGITLGVRSVHTSNQKIYEESGVESTISGTILLILDIVIFYFAFFKREKDGS